MSSTEEILKEQTVLNEAGESIRLADLWNEGPVVLVFVRHFG